MRRSVIPSVFGGGCAAVVLSVTVAGTWLAATPPAATPRTPVLVELFTSEGCSSCPPADELLISLVNEQPFPGILVIPLSEHVEYWNRLGWRDPFSAPVFTERQQQYGEVLGSGTLYTPQMVVDGRIELVGSQRQRAEEAIARAAVTPRATIGLAVTNGPTHPADVDVTVSDLDGLDDLGEADLWLAVTEDGLETDVMRGENMFRRLRHVGVVRHLEPVATIPASTSERVTTTARIALDPEWRVERLRAVVFLQERETRRVVGAAQTGFE